MLQILILLLLIAAVAASVFLLQDIEVSSDIYTSLLPEGHPYPVTEEYYEQQFASGSICTFTIAPPEGTWTPGFFEGLGAFADELEQAEGIEGVISPLDVHLTEDGTLDESSAFFDLWSQDLRQSYIASASRYTLLSELFISTDEQALMLYAQPAAATDCMLLGQTIDRLLEKYAHQLDISVIGSLYSDYLIKLLIIEQLVTLVPIAVFLILIMFYVVTRNGRITILLSLMSFVPGILLFGLFIALGYSFDIVSVIMPVILFGLTTAYSIHLYRSAVHHDWAMHQTLRDILPSILIASSTTVAGYMSLLWIRHESYRRLGYGLLVGIVISIILVCTLLPNLLYRLRTDQQVRTARTLTDPSGKNRRIYQLAVVLLIILLSGGLVNLAPKKHFIDAFSLDFRKSSSFGRMETRLDEHEQGTMFLDIYVDSKEEYGMIDPELLQQIDELSRELRALKSVTAVVALSDVEAMGNGMLSGRGSDLLPSSPEKIGEILEMLSGKSFSPMVDMLIDPDYSTSVIKIYFTVSDIPKSQQQPAITDIEDAVQRHLGTTGFFIAGFPQLKRHYVQELIRIIIKTSIVFILSVIVLGSVLFGSIRQSLLLVMPTMLGMAAFFGLTGWLHIAIEVNVMFALYTFIGISIDDTAYYLLTIRRLKRQRPDIDPDLLRSEAFRETGMSIIETTLVLIVCLTPIVFSVFLNMVWAIVIAMISYAAATLSTLFLVPDLAVRTSREVICEVEE